MKVAVIAVGYNRPASMKRLLDSIIAAEYDGNELDLIISIDRGEKQAQIIDVAKSFEWKHGKKIIRAFEEKQGLRNHIIQCGDFTKEYDAVVVLEDDLEVSKWFFNYVKQVVEFYENDEHIAGISLYKHQSHLGVYRPFEPLNNGYDVYLMQFAMSWGQCWTRRMWTGFKEWYIENEGKDLKQGNILPEYIAEWNKQSWLKYYMRYIVEKDKYFVYPHFSLSTNFSEAGEHCVIPNNDYQVSLLQGRITYRLPRFEKAVRYDVFFERMDIEVFPEMGAKVLLDLYGCRSDFTKGDFAASTRQLPYKKIRELELKYRPIEMNCIYPAKGYGIILYDLKEKCAPVKVNTNILTRFDIRSMHWKKLIKLGWAKFIEAVMLRLKRKK